MERTISHGTDFAGEMRRSTKVLADLGTRISLAISCDDWNVIAPLFAPGNFTIPADQTGRMAPILARAARYLQTRPAAHCAELADCARRAAASREPWRWS
jgi:hypothetical protein